MTNYHGSIKRGKSSLFILFSNKFSYISRNKNNKDMNKKAKQRPLDKWKATETLNKGVAKLINNEVVLPTRAPRKERKVVVDSKTWLYVKEDDKRSDEQIIKDYLKRIS